MKKITFLTLHLGYGGVESAVTALANSLSSDYNVEIISVYKRYEEPIFKLNKNVIVKYLIDHPDIKSSGKNIFHSIKNSIFNGMRFQSFTSNNVSNYFCITCGIKNRSIFF